MAPDRWTARPASASLPSAKCARTSCSRPHTKKEFAADAPRRRLAPGPSSKPCLSRPAHLQVIEFGKIEQSLGLNQGKQQHLISATLGGPGQARDVLGSP